MKKIQNKKPLRAAVRCLSCNQKLFEYVPRDCVIEIKCSRCKKVNLIKINKTHL